MNSVSSVYLLHLLMIFNLSVKTLLFLITLIFYFVYSIFGYNFIHFNCFQLI